MISFISYQNTITHCYTANSNTSLFDSIMEEKKKKNVISFGNDLFVSSSSLHSNAIKYLKYPTRYFFCFEISLAFDVSLREAWSMTMWTTFFLLLANGESRFVCLATMIKIIFPNLDLIYSILSYSRANASKMK